MATVNYIKEQKQSPSAMAGVIAYCSQELKTVDTEGRRYLSGVNCNGDTALQEFLLTKESWRKTSGTNFYQYVQSFSPEEGITHAQAHEIALEFAAKAWPGHEILVATHCDADHPHSHFVINSVSFETGKKLRQNPKTLEQLRKLSDEICLAHGFSVLPPSADGCGRYEKNVRPGVSGGGQGPELEAGAGGSDQRRHVRRCQQRRVPGADERRGLRRHLDRGKKVYHLPVSQRHEMPGQQTA